MRVKLIKIERKMRILLYAFCVYTLLFAVTSVVLPKQADSIVSHYIFIILASLFSFFGGLVIDEEIEAIKREYEWNWKPKTKWDYYCTEWVGLVSIGMLYFMVQMGIAAIFFPNSDQIKIGEHYLYPYLFIFNSIVIYIFYRATIVKIEMKEAEDESQKEEISS